MKRLLVLLYLIHSLCYNAIPTPITVGAGLYTGVLVENRIYLNSYIGGVGTISVINADSFQVVATIPLIGYSGNLTNIGNRVCALSQNIGKATIINTITNTKVATIELGFNSGPYYGVQYENKIFATNYSLSSVSVINLDLIPNGVDPNTPITAPVEAVIELGGTPGYPMIYGNKLLVSMVTGSKTCVIDPKTNSLVATLSGAYNIFAGSFLKDKAYFQLLTGPSVYSYDLKTIDYTLPPTTAQTAPTSVINMDATSHIKTLGEKYIVSCSFGTPNTVISILDTTTNIVTSTTVAGSYCFVANVRGPKAYITSYYDNKIFIVDASKIPLSQSVLTNTIMGEGSPTQAIAYKNRLYITNRNHDTLSVFDTITETFVDTTSTAPVLQYFKKY